MRTGYEGARPHAREGRRSPLTPPNEKVTCARLELGAPVVESRFESPCSGATSPSTKHCVSQGSGRKQVVHSNRGNWRVS